MHTRRILLFTVLLLMAPALATASTARLEGLGVIPTFVDDYANIFSYPASVTRFPGVVMGELGSIEGGDGIWGRGFGMTLGLGQDNQYGVFGMILRENTWFPPAPSVVGEMGTQFDLLWGMNFGKASFGVRFDRTSSELEIVDGPVWSPLYLFYTYDGSDPDINQMNTTGFGLSAELQVRETDRLEATFEYRTLDFELDGLIDPAITLQDKGEPSYTLTGRGFFTMAENVTLVPMVEYLKADYSWELKGPGTLPSADKTITGISAGVGCKVDIGSLFMFGLGFSQWTDEGDATGYTDPGDVDNYELKSTSAPFFFGCLETELKDWLTVRFGARKNLVNQDITIETVGGTTYEYKSKNGIIPGYEFVPPYQDPFLFSMGVGFKFGDLDLDATLNDVFPFTGMYWLSGESTVPFGRISATYHY